MSAISDGTTQLPCVYMLPEVAGLALPPEENLRLDWTIASVVNDATQAVLGCVGSFVLKNRELSGVFVVPFHGMKVLLGFHRY